MKQLGSIIKHYAVVYKELFSNCFAEASTYRLNFVLTNIMDTSLYAISLSSTHFLFNHVDHIGPWGEAEFLFFIAFMMLVNQIHTVFISANFWQFSDDVNNGNLDFLLLKPIGSVFLVFFRRIRAASLFSLLLPAAGLIYFGLNVGLYPLSWVLLLPMVILSLSLMISLEIVLSTSTFWLIEGFGINFLRYQLQQLAFWPHFIFGPYMRKLFLFAIPILLISSGPIHFILDLSQWVWIVLMLVANVICGLLISYIWKKGLRHYESASS